MHVLLGCCIRCFVPQPYQTIQKNFMLAMSLEMVSEYRVFHHICLMLQDPILQYVVNADGVSFDVSRRDKFALQLQKTRGMEWGSPVIEGDSVQLLCGDTKDGFKFLAVSSGRSTLLFRGQSNESDDNGSELSVYEVRTADCVREKSKRKRIFHCSLSDKK